MPTSNSFMYSIQGLKLRGLFELWRKSATCFVDSFMCPSQIRSIERLLRIITYLSFFSRVLFLQGFFVQFVETKDLRYQFELGKLASWKWKKWYWLIISSQTRNLVNSDRWFSFETFVLSSFHIIIVLLSSWWWWFVVSFVFSGFLMEKTARNLISFVSSLPR